MTGERHIKTEDMTDSHWRHRDETKIQKEPNMNQKTPNSGTVEELN